MSSLPPSTPSVSSAETRKFLSIHTWNEALTLAAAPGCTPARVTDVITGDVVQAMLSGIVGVVVENQSTQVTDYFREMHKDVTGPTNNIAIRWYNGPRDNGGQMLATVFFK